MLPEALGHLRIVRYFRPALGVVKRFRRSRRKNLAAASISETNGSAAKFNRCDVIVRSSRSKGKWLVGSPASALKAGFVGGGVVLPNRLCDVQSSARHVMDNQGNSLAGIFIQQRPREDSPPLMNPDLTSDREPQKQISRPLTVSQLRDLLPGHASEPHIAIGTSVGYRQASPQKYTTDFIGYLQTV